MAGDLQVTVRLEEDGTFWATVVQLPGVFATGDTLEELRVSLAEGIALYLAEPGAEPPVVELGELHPTPVETSASVGLEYA